jgi:hypothetical protein
MLSIIICSINSTYFAKVSANISETVGVAYEIIKIDNSTNRYSLAQAYNIGADKALYHYLLFMHEDVAFHTQGWGKALITLLQQPHVGLVGVSGAVYKSKYPSTWSMIPEEYYRINALQRWKDGRITKHIQKESDVAEYSPVAVIDGVFMAVRKEVWLQYKFNEEHLHGFHLYDTDTSLRIGQKYQVVVSHQILLEHFSEGNLSKDWIMESMAAHKRLNQWLPAATVVLTKNAQKTTDYHAASAFCFLLIRHNMFLLAVKFLFKSISMQPIHSQNKNLVIYFLKHFILMIKKLKLISL